MDREDSRTGSKGIHTDGKGHLLARSARVVVGGNVNEGLVVKLDPEAGRFSVDAGRFRWYRA